MYCFRKWGHNEEMNLRSPNRYCTMPSENINRQMLNIETNSSSGTLTAEEVDEIVSDSAAAYNSV